MVLVTLFAVAALNSVATVGKHRDPISGAEASAIVVIDALLIWLVSTL
jgi:hypothetical protein